LEITAEDSHSGDLEVTEFHLGFVNEGGSQRRGAMVPREVDLTVVFPPDAHLSTMLIHNIKQQAQFVPTTFKLKFYSDDGQASFMVIDITRFWIRDLDLEMSKNSERVTYQLKLVVAEMAFTGASDYAFEYGPNQESFEEE
jgi:hypothetical protein